MKLFSFFAIVLWYVRCSRCGSLFASYYESTLHSQMSLNETHAGSLLAPFNRTRTPGSLGSSQVRDFVINEFKSMTQNWVIELHEFEENGYNFTNMVFSLGANDSNYLALAAHYDSKLSPEGFIGGIDSAAPCGMLLYVSHFLDHVLTNDMQSIDTLLLDKFTGVKFIFFDGEEAINEWTATDSLYGSRYAAKKWAQEGTLEKMDMLVLLDLLGGEEDITIPNYKANSRVFFKNLLQIEKAYNKEHNLTHRMLRDTSRVRVHISDDQEPFLDHGITTLHLIPYPFPSTWHTINDNFSNLNEKNIHKWCVLMCEFVFKYWKPDNIPLRPHKPYVKPLN